MDELKHFRSGLREWLLYTWVEIDAKMERRITAANTTVLAPSYIAY
jgi:hypothetical protein